jgi:hypothetical protein
LSVFGQTPLGAKMSSKGTDGVDGFWLHVFTLTKPGAISKDIDAGAPRVLPFEAWGAGVFANWQGHRMDLSRIGRWRGPSTEGGAPVAIVLP